MTQSIRKNAWLQGGTFDNPDLLWYAKGVGVMQSRALNDPTSWWFFAAIHGEYITSDDGTAPQPPADYPNWGDIPVPPKVLVTPLPTQSQIDQYWDQCQHAGWFFPPWHRGYLYKVELILQKIITDLGCPYTWTLPYWNYFGPGDEYKMPSAFAQQSLPDGTPNPLYVSARYGPNGDGNIFIPIPPVSQDCQSNTSYTGDEPDYYGGEETGFEHFDSGTGSLEQNPHNLVHNYVGGQSVNSPYYGGLMGDPGTAALDPIFYLHHCNIDRMWAAWNAAGNINPTDPNWLNGPTATGDRKFYMPEPDGTPWEFTPAMVNSIDMLGYTYDDLAPRVPLQSESRLTQRLKRLGVPEAGAVQQKTTHMATRPELIGANQEALTLQSSGVRTDVRFDPPALNKVSKSIADASAVNPPDEIYLWIENITGNRDSNILTVSVNHQYVGHISLFGLRTASAKDSHHGGAGLTFKFNITDIIDKLHLNNALTGGPLDVLIQPANQLPDSTKITIGRVSVYRKSQP